MERMQLNQDPDHVLFMAWGDWRLRPSYVNLRSKIASTWTLNPGGNTYALPDVELSSQLARLNLAIRSLPDDEQALLDLFYWAYRTNGRRMTKDQIIARSGIPKTTFYRRLSESRRHALRKVEHIGTDWAGLLTHESVHC